MTRSKRSKKGICVYCGGTARLGRDHVPPRALFGGRFPPNLITVPSCDRCNNGASKDDELFRLAYSTRRDAPSVAERDLAFAATLRSFNKPEASSFARRSPKPDARGGKNFASRSLSRAWLRVRSSRSTFGQSDKANHQGTLFPREGQTPAQRLRGQTDRAMPPKGSSASARRVVHGNDRNAPGDRADTIRNGIRILATLVGIRLGPLVLAIRNLWSFGVHLRYASETNRRCFGTSSAIRRVRASLCSDDAENPNAGLRGK